MVGRREIGLLFSNKDGSSFLNIGITFAIFSLSGNTPEYKTWFINSVNDFKITGSITLSNFVEIPSSAHLFLLWEGCL